MLSLPCRMLVLLGDRCRVLVSPSLTAVQCETQAQGIALIFLTNRWTNQEVTEVSESHSCPCGYFMAGVRFATCPADPQVLILYTPLPLLYELCLNLQGLQLCLCSPAHPAPKTLPCTQGIRDDPYFCDSAALDSYALWWSF